MFIDGIFCDLAFLGYEGNTSKRNPSDLEHFINSLKINIEFSTEDDQLLLLGS